MNITYVCGHKNPDTDAIVSAISYAALCNALGDNGYVAVRLGPPNDETAKLLERFGFEAPPLISTVRTQVRDLDFDEPPLLGRKVSVSHAWEILQQDPGLSVLPVTEEDGSIYGVVTAGGIAEEDMRSVQEPVLKEIPLFNALNALEGHVMNGNAEDFDTVSGEMFIALPCAGGCLKNMEAGAVVFCGEQDDVIREALEKKAGCVILCQSGEAGKYRGIESETCVIATPLDVWRAARALYQAIPVERIARRDNLVCFRLEDYLDDVRETVLQSRYRSYPVLDRKNHVVGTLSRYHLIQPKRKRIVLVDHNETSQSVPGLEQAELVGIIDHHRLGDVTTGYPVFMRNEPVGSSTTIVATMYQEHGLIPGVKLAGLMAAAIVSDTVMFKSPTTTQRDRQMAERLARLADIDLEELGKDVFSSNVAEKAADVLLKTDFKEFHIADHALGISQITTMDTAGLIAREDEFLAEMKKMKEKKGYDMSLLMITDVLREGTELVFLGDRDIIRQAFNLNEIPGNHVFLKGVVSRKKQMVPALALLWG
ncbi:MAG: putative manganese-dependent inorganic diphosphatase [Clostridia bacterium]|nr:putative manganese-dependent inorganic diphosphatase [Clostridia bacterium]